MRVLLCSSILIGHLEIKREREILITAPCLPEAMFTHSLACCFHDCCWENAVKHSLCLLCITLVQRKQLDAQSRHSRKQRCWGRRVPGVAHGRAPPKAYLIQHPVVITAMQMAAGSPEVGHVCNRPLLFAIPSMWYSEAFCC